MAHEQAARPGAGIKLVIRNIGVLLSGDLQRPVLDADTVVVKDGRIAAIGREKEVESEGASRGPNFAFCRQSRRKHSPALPDTGYS